MDVYRLSRSTELYAAEEAAELTGTVKRSRETGVHGGTLLLPELLSPPDHHLPRMSAPRITLPVTSSR